MHYARRRGAGIVLISDQIAVSPHKRARPLPRIVRTIIYSVAAPLPPAYAGELALIVIAETDIVADHTLRIAVVIDRTPPLTPLRQSVGSEMDHVLILTDLAIIVDR